MTKVAFDKIAAGLNEALTLEKERTRMTIDLADSIMVTEYVNYLDVTFNGGAVVRLCRCGDAVFPEFTVVPAVTSADGKGVLIGMPHELGDFFSTLDQRGGGIYLMHAGDYDAFLTHIKAGGQQAFEA
jgi:hypothetical protein